MMDRADYYTIAPDAMKALAGVHGYIHDKTELPGPLINLAFLRTSQINGCAFCIDMHSRDLIKGGMSVDKIMLVPVWQEAQHLFTERERAALRWSEVVTSLGEERVPDEEYSAAAAVFEPKELVDLTVAISVMNAYNRMGIAFRRRPAAKV